MLVVDCLAERSFNLFCDVEIIEDRCRPGIVFYYTDFVRGYQPDIILYFVINIFIVHEDAFVGGIEQVSEQSYSTACLLKHELGTLCGFLNF